jgi:hypothetical protein
MTDIPSPLEEEVTIANVAFSDDYVEIDFFDPRRQCDSVLEFTKIMVKKTVFLDQIEELNELVIDLVDEAMLQKRL